MVEDHENITQGVDTVVVQLVENGGLLPPTRVLSFSAHYSQGNEIMDKYRPLFLLMLVR